MNLGQIRGAVQSLGYTTDTATHQNNFINAEYRNVHGKERWPFLETIDSTSVVPVAGTASYAINLTTPWRNLDAVRLSIPGQQPPGTTLNFQDPQELFEHLQLDNQQATPFEWSMYASKIWLYPTPDQTYQCSVYYITEPNDLANDTDIPLIPVPYHDILVWGCVERLAMRERDWLGRQFAQSEKELLLGRLEREYRLRQRQTSSSVKRSGYWNTQVLYPLSSTGF